jgi:phosphatidylserine decarboxylase
MYYFKLIIFCIGILGTIHLFNRWFNRAPQRTTPSNNVVISPASGKVIEIVHVTTPEITFIKEGTRNTVTIPQLSKSIAMILIEMTPLDVHVQRAPIDGMVTAIDYYDGKHHNALGKKKIQLAETNEKMVTVFSNDEESVGVIQVAGKAARRIRTNISVQDTVVKGQIYGRIILGSQVVVLVPEPRVVQVQVGDRVIDGETILAQ